MAFIPIIAKEDGVAGSRKGKITPAQMAQLFAWTLKGKTGILNTLGKCEAYQTSNAISGGSATITFKSGYLVICGRLVECQEGTTYTLNNLVSGAKGMIVAKFDLQASAANEFQISSITGSPIQQDLNEYPTTGVYEFPLYTYSVIGNKLTLFRDILSSDTYYIDDVNGLVDNILINFNSIKGNGFRRGRDYINPSEVSSIEAPLHFYDVAKGTIENRLSALTTRMENLGFKQGSVSGIEGATLTKQGKYAILKLPEIRLQDGITTLTMSMTSNETFTQYLYGEVTLGWPYVVANFTKGSNVVTLEAKTDITLYTARVGFEVSSW